MQLTRTTAAHEKRSVPVVYIRTQPLSLLWLNWRRFTDRLCKSHALRPTALRSSGGDAYRVRPDPIIDEHRAEGASAGRDQERAQPQAKAESGELVEAGVRARMCECPDSFASDKSLTVVANLERSGPHKGCLVLRLGDHSGDIIASLSLSPDSLQLAQVRDHVVEVMPLAPGQPRTTSPEYVVYLVFRNSARFDRFRTMLVETACPVV
jgi:hypothetical protein